MQTCWINFDGPEAAKQVTPNEAFAFAMVLFAGYALWHALFQSYGQSWAIEWSEFWQSVAEVK